MAAHGCTGVPCTICGRGAALNLTDDRTPASYFDVLPAPGIPYVPPCVLGVEGLQSGDLVEVVSVWVTPKPVPAIYLYSIREPFGAYVSHCLLVGLEKRKLSDMDSYITRVIHRLADAT